MTNACTREMTVLLYRAPADSLAELAKINGVADPTNAWAIARAICLNGGSTVANAWRGGGVPYAEVVADVAGLLGVAVHGQSVAELEQLALDAAWTRFMQQATPQELADIAELAQHERDKTMRGQSGKGTAKVVAASLVPAVLAKLLGRQLFLHLLRTVVLPRLGLWTAARIAIAGPVAVLGPIGLALGAATILYEADKPSLRKTVHSVLLIAALRGASLEPSTVTVPGRYL